MTFDEQVAKYLKRPAIQAQIKAHYKKTGGSAEDITQVIGYAQKAVAAIIDSLPYELKGGSSRPITTTDLIIGEPRLNDNGDFEVELRWNPDAIHRESLYEEGYPEGLEDIVSLFSTGSKLSKNWVAGYGKYRDFGYRYFYIPKGTYREPDPFISHAVSAFNAAHAKDHVVLIAPKEYY